MERRSAPSFVSSKVAGNVSSAVSLAAVVSLAARCGSLACVWREKRDQEKKEDGSENV